MCVRVCSFAEGVSGAEAVAEDKKNRVDRENVKGCSSRVQRRRRHRLRPRLLLLPAPAVSHSRQHTWINMLTTGDLCMNYVQ